MRWIAGPVMLLLACTTGRADPLPPFVGHWLGAYHGQPIDLQLAADGSGRYQDQPVQWRFRYGQLQLDRNGDVEVYTMKADHETLMLAGGPEATLLMLHRLSDEEPVVRPAP